MITVEDLKSYRYLAKEIKSLDVELLELRASATRATANLSGLPSGKGRPNDLSTPVARIMDLSKLVEAKRNELRLKREEIEQQIAVLPANERHVLRQYYLRGRTMISIAIEMNFSDRWVKKLHARGVKKFLDSSL